MNFTVITKVGTKIATKAAKHSPEILLGVGIAGIIGTVVLACIETKKAKEVIEEAHEELDKVDLHVCPKKVDYIRVYAKTGVKIARVYAPSVLLGSFSIGCLVGSHHILNKRYLGTAAAYTLLDDSFTKYRDKVKGIIGEEVEKTYFSI